MLIKFWKWLKEKLRPNSFLPFALASFLCMCFHEQTLQRHWINKLKQETRQKHQMSKAARGGQSKPQIISVLSLMVLSETNWCFDWILETILLLSSCAPPSIKSSFMSLSFFSFLFLYIRALTWFWQNLERHPFHP